MTASGASLFLNMRKREPKSSTGLANLHPVREMLACPELTHATCTPRRLTADRLPAPLSSSHRAGPFKEAIDVSRNLYSVPDKSPDKQTMGIRCRGLGEICARLHCPLEGKPPLTAKSLSAKPV